MKTDDVGFPFLEAIGCSWFTKYKWRFGLTGNWQGFVIVDADPATGAAVVPANTFKNGSTYGILVRWRNK